ncbi:MAG: TIGR00282 family metallophosphoesterase [Caldiserica bacterium]|nr:TIGR00282 family metallophosphoesterase [Caldisericota bacterium]
MRLLFIGDVFGRPGRTIVRRLLPQLKQELQATVVVANTENATHGTGMTRSAFEELSAAGVDIFTGGNHTLGKPEILDLMQEYSQVLCPGNVSPAIRSHGSVIWQTPDGPLAVINVMGQYCMNGVDNPFRYVEEVLHDPQVGSVCVKIVDFHAEATAEKAAMLSLLDGHVSAVLGTHTHVPTADARITSAGTAFITDVGMTGVRASIIGLDPEVMMRRFQTGIMYAPRVAEGDATLMAVVIDIDAATGSSTSITLLQRDR